MVLQRSRVVRVLVAIALVSLAAVGLRLSEGEEDAYEVVRGVVGEPVAINGGTVTASRVRVGTSLVRFDRVEGTTPGLFVAVRLEIGATGAERIKTFNARLLSGDRRYTTWGSSVAGLVDPGFEESLDVAFEVDPATLHDLTLELDPAEVLSGYPQHVRIHLGITPENAEQWRAAGREQTIELADRSTRGI